MGRPAIQITEDQYTEIERLASIAVSQRRIAHYIGISPATLENRVAQGDERIVRALETGRANVEVKTMSLIFDTMESTSASRKDRLLAAFYLANNVSGLPGYEASHSATPHTDSLSPPTAPTSTSS